MFCRNCGKPIEDGAKFCVHCGAPVSQAAEQAPPRKEKKRGLSTGARVAILAAVCVVLFAGGWLLASTLGNRDSADPVKQPSVEENRETQPAEEQPENLQQPADAQQTMASVEAMPRPQLLNFSAVEKSSVTPSVAPYRVEPGLANVGNVNQFYLSDASMRLLEQNLFLVKKDYNSEFFELYEYNRYAQIPNFVTVDSMMHTYHLYFSLLLNRTEKNYLASELLGLSKAMLQASMAQYDALAGTQWEEAAHRNVAFFAVAAMLQDPDLTAPGYASELAAREMDSVYAAAGIGQSGVAEDFVDYSQFQPRGYYEGDEVLERYFRAMMWYGQINFAQKEDSLNRSALLMTLAMREADLAAWEEIYTVTSFFAGTSDDLGYYEYAPAIEAAFGAWPAAGDLAGQEDAYESFTVLIGQMEPPAINSVPVWESEEGNVAQMKKGFRFMGQRFTIDAAVMQQLIYRNVEENSSGEKRMLPDTLDLPAALGSELALKILTEQGDMDYAGYSENMTAIRNVLTGAPEEFWLASLYSSWLYTLEPLLEEKGNGYPSFMTSEQWLKKDLETYAGSFAELKHDTVLYSKQVMAEMGGGPQEVIDDRGYVEPETEVYRRFMLLAQQTAEGLHGYGLIGSEDLENLSRLEELARRLLTISEKELSNESLTEEEYDLIREYGGTLEHFWTEAVKDKTESAWLDAKEIPAALVTDIATDPNGSVLQIATGRPAEVVVVVPVDGQLRLASGVVFDFYQFEQPMSNRLTDTQWRQMIGQWMNDDGTYNWDSQVEKPWWTQSYWFQS